MKFRVGNQPEHLFVMPCVYKSAGQVRDAYLFKGQLHIEHGVETLYIEPGALGGVFGALCGLFWAWVFAKLFVSFVFPILNSKLPEVFVSEMVESTVVKLCLKINPLAFLMYAANWFAGLFR